MQFLQSVIIVAALLAGQVYGQCTDPPEFTWDGSNSAAWDDRLNWTPDTRVPGEDDRAYIPSVSRYPIIDGNHVTVCELELEKTGNSNPTLTIAEHATTSNAITVSGRNGLKIGAECEIRIAKAVSVERTASMRRRVASA